MTILTFVFGLLATASVIALILLSVGVFGQTGVFLGMSTPIIGLILISTALLALCLSVGCFKAKVHIS
ncbi:hypothetical protein [Candidatus Chlamydia sanziniae]|uniref:Uncharacterized protein n=1 Tax=Candidatus Chlamydia sanziniae TaxID=1806891 RepID=A0A1A9HXW3_9CHLA|nr:hypothetical protein [Candidatus Chlamydia sanziniae]ANH78884.1 hypothetical protein Cs308_0714 [Candidatus Chlamydia sanziniae]